MKGAQFSLQESTISSSSKARRREQAALRLHRRLAAHWCPNRGTAGSHLVTRQTLDATPPVIMVWRSVRAGGDTKTRKSRRMLELPQRCTDALRLHRDCQDRIRKPSGGQVARQRPRCSPPSRHRALGWKRPSFVPRRSHCCGPQLGRLDATPSYGTASSRLLGRRCPYREDRPPCRPHRDDHHRNRLPQADPSRWSSAAQKSWTACFPGGTPMRSYSDSYSVTKGHDSRWVVMASDLVGRTGFEPVTSSVSSGNSRVSVTVGLGRAGSH